MDTLHDFRRLVCNHCGHTVDVPIYCGDRFCSICSRGRAFRLKLRLNSLFDYAKRTSKSKLRFMTLTIRSVPDLPEMIKSIQASFRRVRQTQTWKNFVEGGVSVIEVTKNGDGWHVHVHAIVQGSFLPVRLLSRVWQSSSGSPVVHIRAVQGASAISYLCKYVLKSDVSPDIRAEVNDAFRGVRMFQPFGSWSGAKLPPLKVPYICPHCGQCHWLSLGEVLQRLLHSCSDFPSGP